jgi:hypothetical protein
MEVTAVVLHDGALAEYEVEIGREGLCTARLSRYNGKPENQPPQCVSLHKEGRHWIGDITNKSLSDDLGYAVEIKAKPLLDGRKRQAGHPAG